MKTEVEELKAHIELLQRALRRGGTGCLMSLAPGQWWSYCGEIDMGGPPALCTECGGRLMRRDPNEKAKRPDTPDYGYKWANPTPKE